MCVRSAGRSTAAVNLFLGAENDARKVVLMKPGIPLRYFDAAVIPRHDDPPRRRNVVETRAAPNLVDAESLEEAGRALADKARNISDTPKVGVLMGGDTKDCRVTTDLARDVLRQVREAAKDLGMGVLVTTSRRTPREVERVVDDETTGDPATELVIIANRRNIPRAVEGILGLSRMVVVSGESISMVSEAASSGRAVLVFEPEKRVRNRTKYERVVDDLAGDGYVRKVRPLEVAAAIRECANAPDEARRVLDDGGLVEKALGGLL